MWNSSSNPEDIRVPEDPAVLDVVMGRRYQRALTHKGVEFQGLYYNSPELHKLRCRKGSELSVEIRVDESDLGHIFVLSPKEKEVFTIPAVRRDYATGIGLFQHRVIRSYQKRHASLEPSPDGWLQAKEEIVEIIENETRLSGNGPTSESPVGEIPRRLAVRQSGMTVRFQARHRQLLSTPAKNVQGKPSKNVPRR